jgi:hypothetical protein
MTEVKPIQWAVYKGMGAKHGAVQFNLMEAHYRCGTCKKRYLTGATVAKANATFKPVPCPARDTDSHTACNGELSIREGCVFIEMAPTVGKNKYDWNERISFALSPGDMSKILFAIRTQGGDKSANIKILHDPFAKTQKAGQVTKNLFMSWPGTARKGALLTLSMSDKPKNVKKSHTVPLNGEELLLLTTLLESSIPRVLGWG